MNIKSKLTERDFIDVNFILLYSRTSMKIVTAIIIFFLFGSLLTAFFLPTMPLSQAIVPAVMLSAMPLMTYFTAKKNYASNKRISETIEYVFEKDNLLIKGESFNSQLTWDKINKVTQTKNWILIWQSRQNANPISKRDIWEGEIGELKEILTQHNVKNNL